MARISFTGKELPVGVDIGANQIRGVQLKKTGNSLSLHSFGAVPISHEATREGEIINVGMVAEGLRSLFKHSSFTGKIVATGVANQQTIFRLIEFPWTDPKDLKNVLMLQAQDYIPIPVDEAMIDFTVLGEKVNDEGERVQEIMLAAVQHSVIDNIVEAFQQAGLKLARIDLTALAISRSLLAAINLQEAEKEIVANERVAILHVSSGLVNLAIIDKGMPRFVRFLPQGGQHLTLALSKELELPFGEAERLKIAVGLPSFDGSSPILPEFGPEMVAKAQATLEREVSALISEIRLSFDFFISGDPSHEPITKIYATGSAVRLENMDAYLTTALNAEVMLSDPFDSIEVPAHLIDNLGDGRYSYTPSIGYALGGR